MGGVEIQGGEVVLIKIKLWLRCLAGPKEISYSPVLRQAEMSIRSAYNRHRFLFFSCMLHI